ncbi:hypothetical protein GQ43DRAFT_437341 [Delitschia confertaspora ATCC 74209]|uniref:Autophagy-related protein 29 n=1 Tax=Delitschia confertaspora ATCC 74209 TaxID=1513339 RepID=A0A9P4JTN6_9PLEO|nr:hypothetical protein GQ43DRAFT_437341 [Delitschia confertaspora ATCC 74209]
MSAIQFTTIIRLPFARGEFTDPIQVDWDATKDRALWKVISKSSKTSDVNWEELAVTFQVSPTFMLQQAAWLYERHLEHVRAQMKKVGNTVSIATTWGGASNNVVTTASSPKRVGNTDVGASRTSSSLSEYLTDSNVPRGNSDTPVPSLSRVASTNTVIRSHTNLAEQRRDVCEPKPRTTVGLSVPSDRTTSAFPSGGVSSQTAEPESPTHSSSSSSSQSSDSDMHSLLHRSQLFRRPPRFHVPRSQEMLTSDDATDRGIENHTPSMLPFANLSFVQSAGRNDHLRKASSTPYNTGQHPPPNRLHKPNKGTTLAGGVDEGSPEKRRPGQNLSPTRSTNPPASSTVSSGLLSPSHRAESGNTGPKRRLVKGRREGSEGTPSIGSSFSDLDDASITQSALEEALLSNIQHGRMSTLSQLRSRYL